MLDKISNKILEKISSNSTDEEKEVLLFGITRIVEDIPKTLGIIAIGLILGIIKEMIIVTIIIAVYKSFVGGVHSKTNFGCFIYSALFYLITIYSAKFLVFTNYNKYGLYALIYIFAIYTIIVYVPADVPEIPKVNLELRKKLKIRSLISLNIIYLFCILVLKDTLIINLIIYSIFFISLMTIRTIYKIFKNDYGYETYVPEKLI